MHCSSLFWLAWKFRKVCLETVSSLFNIFIEISFSWIVILILRLNFIVGR
uniref:Uncharacterized protein n=1 Tax=Lepeophtheirus salmonis TaxID=72036 RepID=A0A0K2U075_LEPSM